jgi:hypothetical protein
MRLFYAVCLVAVVLALGAIVGVAASGGWEYNYPAAETGEAPAGTPTTGLGPGATVPPPADTQAEEEVGRHLNEKAEREAKEKAKREAAAARCVVPSLKHKSLADARTLLSSAHCRLGRVRWPRGHHRALVVLVQHPAGGRTLSSGAAVELTLGIVARRR